MEYAFKKYYWGDVPMYGIIPPAPTIIINMSSWDWTPEKIQSIIDGVEESKTKEKGEEYFWGNEDVRLYANKNGVFLIDDLGSRAGETDPDKLYLILSHDEMLQFLKDFKKFVEENS